MCYKLLLSVSCDELHITSSKLFSSVLPYLIISRMAEQAQSDADDLDGLQEISLDGTQDQADPATNGPYAKLIQELQQPDTPPAPPQGRQRQGAAPTGTRQAAQKSVKRHSDSIRKPNRQNATGLQAPRRPNRLGEPRRPNHQPPPPEPHPRLGKRNCSHVRPSRTPPTSSNKEKVRSLIGN